MNSFPTLNSQVVESVLNKVMEEVQQRLSIHNEMVRESEFKYSQYEVLIDLAH